VVSLAKGLVPPDGTPPTVALAQAFGTERVGCVGGPAHAREMVESGAGLVCASQSADLAHRVAEMFQDAGVVCEASADIFSEVTALARSYGAQRKTFIGRAGIGDLVATALAPTSRNRSAGELLAQGVPSAEIPERLGQAAEALETVPLLARAIERAGVEAPVTSALARLIEGSLPLDDWVALVRARQPEPARFGGNWFRRLLARFRRRRV
jgi:glycerol-3-phosphate dehydrogenase (NAD(P)+)